MTRVVSLLLVQLLTHFHFGTGFYFELSDKSQVQRCFIEDVDDSATFKGEYIALLLYEVPLNLSVIMCQLAVFASNLELKPSSEYEKLQ